MRILALAVAVLITFSVHAQKSFGCSITTGTDFTDTENVLYPVIGEYYGVKSNYRFTPCFRFGAMPELRLSRLHIAAGANLIVVPYDEVVHRYKIYYAPSGNPFGGHIYNEIKGRYLMLELAVRLEQMVYTSEKVNFGFTAGGALGKERSFDYAYSTLSAGVTVARQVGPVELALRPQALFFLSQKIKYFFPFAARIEFSVRFGS